MIFACVAETYTMDRIQWFCGFYEGEGYVSNDISNNNRLRLGIAQNDRTPLDIAMSIWGGHIHRRDRKSPASGKQCIGYEWRLTHSDAMRFLADIRPHMLIPYKIQQVETAIARAEHGIQRRFQCPHCLSTYASPAGRRRHVKKTHECSDASPKGQDNQIAGNPLESQLPRQ